MWYITINGHRDGTPYQTFQEAFQASFEIKARMTAVCIDFIHED